MKYSLRFMCATVVSVCCIVFFSCVTQEPARGDGPGRSRGKNTAEMILMNLKGLLDPGMAQSSLAITSDQAATILPVLKDWKSRETDVSDGLISDYCAKITAILTAGQKAYHPEPPQGNDKDAGSESQFGNFSGSNPPPSPQDGSRGKSRPGEQTGSGDKGGSGNQVSALLTELIKTLSSY